MRALTRQPRSCPLNSACLCCLLLVLGWGGFPESIIGFAASPSSTASREYQLKAAFLLRFCQFVEWPESAFEGPNSPLVIAVLGPNPFGDSLEAIRGQSVNKRKITVEHYTRVDEIRRCHVLFVNAADRSQLEQMLNALGSQSILTVGDLPAFAENGGIIGLYTAQERIRYKINLKAARAARLEISSKLLRLGEVVKTRE